MRPTAAPRRLWRIAVDDRSGEIGWTFGSKVFRSRHEDGKFGGFLHYDLAVPYNEGRPLPGWSVGLPQFHKGIPRDGRLLRITQPDGDSVYLDFFYEPLGVPGSLLCELNHTLGERSHAKEDKADRANVAVVPDRKRQRVG